MEKDFLAGWNYDEYTGIKERLYLNCYTPVSIDKWFDRIHLKPEMENLLLKIYHKIGMLEGICGLLSKEELKCTDDLIDRCNLMRCQADESQMLDSANYFSYSDDSGFLLEEKKKIQMFSELQTLKKQHRENFIIRRQTISALRKEWNPTVPYRIGDCLDDLLRITLEFKSKVRRGNEPLNPVLFSGLFYHQLLTIVPCDKNNMLHSSYAVAKYLWELQILTKISLPLSKLMYDNKNECDDRMAEVRQSCNMNQWLLFYLDMLDKALGKEYSFINEKHIHMDKSQDTLDKAKNIPNQLKERMKRELNMMCQNPVFRIEDVMKDCNITHSTATKMVNLFIELNLVRQMNDKQRYRIYEYIPLMECIRRI